MPFASRDKSWTWWKSSWFPGRRLNWTDVLFVSLFHSLFSWQGLIFLILFEGPRGLDTTLATKFKTLLVLHFIFWVQSSAKAVRGLQSFCWTWTDFRKACMAVVWGEVWSQDFILFWEKMDWSLQPVSRGRLGCLGRNPAKTQGLWLELNNFSKYFVSF